jgi:hypothetical protein
LREQRDYGCKGQNEVRSLSIPQIREEAIRRKAYEIWQKTGNPDAVANWLLAEKVILSGEISL